MDTSQIEIKLIAAASIVGFDKALAIIEAERRPFLDFMKHASGVLFPVVTPVTKGTAEIKTLIDLDEQGPARQKRPYRRVATTGLKDGIMTILANGATPISDLLIKLFHMHRVSNTGPETRKAVMNILKSDDHFARGKAGNSYKLRTSRAA